MARKKFDDPAVGEAFKAYPKPVRDKLLGLRQMIYETAAETDEVGEIEETLKWGQPSYQTVRPKSGSPIRLGQDTNSDGGYALYFHCQTNLVATFRELYGDRLKFGGNRAIFFEAGDKLPKKALRHCIGLALTYHSRKRG